MSVFKTLYQLQSLKKVSFGFIVSPETETRSSFQKVKVAAKMCDIKQRMSVEMDSTVDLIDKREAHNTKQWVMFAMIVARIFQRGITKNIKFI